MTDRNKALRKAHTMNVRREKLEREKLEQKPVKEWNTVERKKYVCDRCISDIRQLRVALFYVQNPQLQKKYSEAIDELEAAFQKENTEDTKFVF